MQPKCVVAGFRLPFECISRADRLNEEMVDLLAELGCFRIWIGSESGSQRILDAMERGVQVEQVQKAVELCRSRGIQSGMFLMWGYEGEELQDIEATIEHVKRSRSRHLLHHGRLSDQGHSVLRPDGRASRSIETVDRELGPRTDGTRAPLPQVLRVG